MHASSSSKPQYPGRIAGIDFGTVRIGIAVTDRERLMASPHQNYTRRSAALDAEFFRRLAADEGIVQFVVGLPVHLDGNESQKSFEARTFGKWLADATGVPVVYFDERFSTSQAEDYLADARLTKKKRKARLDMLAAQVMLTAYLESGQVASDVTQGLDD